MSDLQANLAEPSVHGTDDSNFLDVAINQLIAQSRSKDLNLSRDEELNIGISYCKSFLTQKEGDKRRRIVLDRLVELKLELHQLKELAMDGKENELALIKLKCHEFVLQSASGRNPYCEVCLCTVWRLAQRWRRCSACGFRSHEKCINEVKRSCVSNTISSPEFSLNFVICPESNLAKQNFRCAECFEIINNSDRERLPRLCDYTGSYYCHRCHWNDMMVIPARLIRNWDAEKRPCCRASKQLLKSISRKPIIDLYKENSRLFHYVSVLGEVRKLRNKIMLMKCYLISCKGARSIRILQYLNKHQHFVENEVMYSLNDLEMLAHGKLLVDIREIVQIFQAHITENCEVCRGNAFFCELCSSNERIYSFDEDASICDTCSAVFHTQCFVRVSKRCPRCARRCGRQIQWI